MYSQNEKLKYYKSGLIKTKSVDHLTPYNHSNKFLVFNDNSF